MSNLLLPILRTVTNYGGRCIQTYTMPKLGSYCAILIFLYENKCIVRTLSKYRIPTQWLTAYPNRKHLSQVILSWQCYLTSYFLADIGWVVYKVSGLIPASSSLHVELSSGMTLNPKLTLVYPWVCTWILELVNVAIYKEKSMYHLNNTSVCIGRVLHVAPVM